MNNKIKNLRVILPIILTMILGILVSFNNMFVVIPIILLGIIIFVKNIYVTIIILILCNESVFFLLGRSVPFHIIMLGILITIIYLIIGILALKRKNKFNKPYFSNSIALIIATCIFEIINAYIINGQPLILGLQSIQFFFRYLFYFYFILNISNREQVDKIKKIIMTVGVIASFIYILQSIFYPKVIFLDIIFGERNGFVRFYDGMYFVLFSTFITIDYCLKKKSKRIYIYLLIEFTYFILVAQTRNVFIAFLTSTILIWIISRDFKIKTKYITIIILISVFMLNIVNYSNDIDFLGINSLSNELMQGTGTGGFRYKEIDFYINKLNENPLLGLGFYSDSYEKTYYIMGRDKQYYSGDIGIIGFIFHVGIIGAILCLNVLVKSYKLLFLSKKALGFRYYYMWYMVVFISASLPFGVYIQDASSIIYISMFLAIFEKELKYDLISKQIERPSDYSPGKMIAGQRN